LLPLILLAGRDVGNFVYSLAMLRTESRTRRLRAAG
jgi:hypothetical protein